MRLKIWTLVLLWIPVLNTGRLVGQCQNSTQFPAAPVMPSAFSDTVLVTDEQYAGQFYVIEGLSLEETYVFLCSGGGTYLTIRDVYNPATVITHGAPPLTWTVPAGGPDLVAVHVSLLSPPCGIEDPSEATPRTSQLVCTSCPGLPPSVGIGISAPEAVLDVSGEIRVGNVQSPPKAGMIRWNPASGDFEGFDGARWLSFTQSMGLWGRIPSREVNENLIKAAEDGAASDYFGSAVSISGSWAVCGTYADDIGANEDQGSITFFLRSDTAWTETETLFDPNGEAFDGFGQSVAVFGDFALAGAGYDDVGANVNQGSVTPYMRVGNQWIPQAVLIASDGEESDFFGLSVAVSHDYLIVGARFDDIGDEADQGSAYIFKRIGNDWVEEAKLTAMDGTTSDEFGTSVAIYGDYALVGAQGCDLGSNVNQGAAYVFHRNGTSWSQQAKLTASDGDAGDRLGCSVSMDGEYALVGAYSDAIGGNTGQGSAYVFKRDGGVWSQQAKLIAEDGSAFDNFGGSVSIFGEYAVAGSIGKDIGTEINAGAAYVFTRNGSNWGQSIKLTASDKKTADFFGATVAISSDTLIIGVTGDDVNGNSSQGSVYFFNRNQ